MGTLFPLVGALLALMGALLILFLARLPARCRALGPERPGPKQQEPYQQTAAQDARDWACPLLSFRIKSCHTVIPGPTTELNGFGAVPPRTGGPR